jgi:hypothetical protein
MKRSRSPEEATRSPPATTTGDSPDSNWTLDSSEPDVEEPAAKIVELDPAVLAQENVNGTGPLVSQQGRQQQSTMKCSLPPHREGLAFASYAEYESHYRKAHTNRCVECRKNFPSEHLLNVHIEECHDSFVAVKRERGEHTVGA